MIRFIATSNEEEDLLADELSDEARWKLREEMKQAILPWRPARFMSVAPAKYVQPTPKQ
jgi:hypothetical protein